MNKREIAENVVIDCGGIARNSDFTAAGLKNYEVAALCKKGFLERIRAGIFQLPGSEQITDEKFIKELLPYGVVCVESAIFHYGYSLFAPPRWSIAVTRNSCDSLKRLDSLPVKGYLIHKDFFQIGKSKDDFNGVELAVYDRERTICDCFKYRTALYSETFHKAISTYIADEKKNPANLPEYAREMKIYEKVMKVMEPLLGG